MINGKDGDIVFCSDDDARVPCIGGNKAIPHNVELRRRCAASRASLQKMIINGQVSLSQKITIIPSFPERSLHVLRPVVHEIRCKHIDSYT